MTEPSFPPGEILLDEVVPPGRPWGHRIAKGDILRLIDLEGRHAVDFLCYDAEDPTGPLLRDQHDQGPGKIARR